MVRQVGAARRAQLRGAGMAAAQDAALGKQLLHDFCATVQN
jgi:hypothetical protein